MARHNKKRNAGLLYEFLVRKISRSFVDEDNQSAEIAKKLIQKYFQSGTELHKEYRLVNALVNVPVGNEQIAAAVLEEARRASVKFDSKSLKIEKDNLSVIYNSESAEIDVSIYEERQTRNKKKGVTRKAGVGLSKQMSDRIERAGFEINGDNLILPLAISVNVGNIAQPQYKTFILEEVQTNSAIEKSEMSTSNFTPLLLNSSGTVLGHRGIYKEFKSFGSMQQNPMGFMWGDRSTYEYLQNKIDKTTSAVEDGSFNPDAIFDYYTQENVPAVGPGTNVNINATNDSIETTDNDNIPVSLSKIEKLSEQGEFDFDAITEGIELTSGLKSEAMDQKPEQLSLFTQNKVLENFYNDLTRLDKKALADAANISNLEELLEDFNNPANQYNEEDFIENLKKCYSK